MIAALAPKHWYVGWSPAAPSAWSPRTISLAKIADTLDGKAVNVHFEDHLEGGEIRFDYQLRPGVVTRSNALELMRSVGLDV
jgi:hypothetical protein